MPERSGKNVLLSHQPVNLHPAPTKRRLCSRIGKLKTVATLPGTCYSYLDRLTQERTHSFAFQVDQTRKVAIDIVNQRSPRLFEEFCWSRKIQVTLWCDDRGQELFTVAPGDRGRETVTLKPGQYLLELKTQTSKKVDYTLKLTPLKWLLLDCFASRSA